MALKKNIRQLRRYVTGAAIVFIYLVQILGGKVGYIKQWNYLETIFLSIFIGAITYTSVTLFIWFRTRFANKNSNTSATVKSVISTRQLNVTWNHATRKIHELIVNSSQIPDFDSELVDGMSEEFTKSWLTSCMAFCYGLVVICMLKKDASFLGSNVGKEFQLEVMRKMVRNVQGTDLVYGLDVVTNNELVATITSDLKEAILAAHNYLENENNVMPLTKLIEFLGDKINKDLTQTNPDIEHFSNNLLTEIDAQIEKKCTSPGAL